jgi:hypothetical protein
MGDPPYEDDNYVEDNKLPTLNPDEFRFGIRHKKSRNLFWVSAKDRQELADTVDVGDWEPDPQNDVCERLLR